MSAAGRVKSRLLDEDGLSSCGVIELATELSNNQLAQYNNNGLSVKPHKRVKVDMEQFKLQKQQSKKLAAFQLKKSKLKKRQLLFRLLQKNAAQSSHLSLIKSSRDIGSTKLTRKQSLKLALKQHKIGLPIDDERFYQEREQVVDFSLPLPSLPDSTHSEFTRQFKNTLQKPHFSTRNPQTSCTASPKESVVKLKKKSQIFYANSKDSDSSDEQFSSDQSSSDEEGCLQLGTVADKIETSHDSNDVSPNDVTVREPTPEASQWIIPDFPMQASTQKSGALNTATSMRKVLGVEVAMDVQDEPSCTLDCLQDKAQFTACESLESPLTSTLPDSSVGVLNDGNFGNQVIVGNDNRNVEHLSNQVIVGDDNKSVKSSAYYVQVLREEEVIEFRSKLPIFMQEPEIMETISNNDFVIICGETGSGKTTQVPQFLYEAGYGCPNGPYPGMIGVTEPRRIAAISTAKRVAYELNQSIPGTASFKQSPGHVSYQVRYDSASVSNQTRIKFMTDGILLRHVERDFLLNSYSVILIDEAHERTINTDLLLGLLCRIVPLRRSLCQESSPPTCTPLKVVIMSATLRVSDFVQNRRMFPSQIPPVINVQSRQYPVTIHFSKNTRDDYVKAAYRKVMKIHQRLPPGGILVFLTGEAQVLQLVRKLNDKLMRIDNDSDGSESDDDDNKLNDNVDTNNNDNADTNNNESTNYLDCKLNLLEQEKLFTQQKPQPKYPKARIVALYSALKKQDQMLAFETPPSDTRLIVVATNIAETSLTIPGINYVVDSGRVKVKTHDATSGVINFKVEWTSAASADQRAGRAGRTASGHCYRLYSSAVYEQLPPFANPQILDVPIDHLVLQMKNMGIEHLEVFPFPTPPDIIALEASHRTLTDLGALERLGAVERQRPQYRITALGRSMCRLPVAPRYSKMLLIAANSSIFHHVVALVACLATGNPFYSDCNTKPHQYQALIDGPWKRWKDSSSDLLACISLIGFLDGFQHDWRDFCQQYSLNLQVLCEIRQLRTQLLGIVHCLTHNESNAELIAPDVDYASESIQPRISIQKLGSLTERDRIMIRQVITAGLPDRIAKLSLTSSSNTNSDSYKTCRGDLLVKIHPSSFLKHDCNSDYLAYNQIIQGSNLLMHSVTAVQLAWMPSLCPWLCLNMDVLLNSPLPRYDAEKDQIVGCFNPSYINHDWQVGHIMLPISDTLNVCKNIARCFIDGQIFEKMNKFQPFLNTSSRSILTNWTNRKVLNLIQPLIDKKISNRVTFINQWKKDPKFWASNVLPWYDKCVHQQIIGIWPPI